MRLKGLRKKMLCLGLSAAMAAALSGCGGSGERTQGAVQMIGELDYEGALEQLDLAQENGENVRLVDRARGIAYMGLTDYEQAAVCFEEALAGSDGLVQNVDFDLNFYLAAAYTKSQRYGEAEDIYDAVLALRPGAEDAYFLRGNVRLVQGNYEGAKADFDKVISMDPKNYDRLIQIYQVLDYFDHGETGREYLQAALASGDKDMDKYASGRIHYYLGEYQSAYLDLEEARETGGVESYLYLGKSYEATGDYNYAANVYNSYLEKNEGNAEIYNQLGLCEMARGEYRNALNAFQAGMQLQNVTMMQTLSFNEIVAYEHLGDYRQASILMENYLKNYPDDAQAKREYEFLSTR
ncbi:MAG: tetratricopeptide repeat protein [Lachnospiraceae bacterium]|nr:tetratricopeptide repeat protein [uncultured Acetatifactor sp.]MCI9231952.1 tetratricopeptide repeat protein [Lachnospiraceae bacterium]MCI9572524.1 tetratricopeptide repeat protein [Lachnospiraceae bacterium]